MFRELKCIIRGDHGDLEHLAGLTLIVHNPDVLQQRQFEELLKLKTLSIILALDRSLQNVQSLRQVQHAFEVLLSFKKLDLRGGDNSINGADEDGFALADAYFSDLPQRSVPSLLHSLTIIEILEPVRSHSP